jgi:hypothetical protein
VLEFLKSSPVQQNLLVKSAVTKHADFQPKQFEKAQDGKGYN